jgi:hypothetical protein
LLNEGRRARIVEESALPCGLTGVVFDEPRRADWEVD